MIFKTLSDVYKQKVTEEGVEEVLVKKDVMTRKSFELKDIGAVSEAYNERGRVYKTRCVVVLKDGQQFFLKHRFDEVVEMSKPLKIRGFGK